MKKKSKKPILNMYQKIAYEAVVNSDDKVIVLTGEGGSGKSFVTGEIIKDWDGSISVTATTNQAKNVLARMSSTTSNTTQSEMGYVMVRSGFTQQLKQVRDPIQNKLLIVDETSMLPFKVYKTIMESIESGKIAKVLFLGDEVQLPSIGKGIKLSDIEGTHISLSKQMRQAHTDKTTIKYLAGLRKAILNKKEAPSLKGLENIYTYTDHKEFCKAYNSSKANKKIVAYRNRVVDKYNEYAHTGEEVFNVGDIVVINKPIIMGKTVIAANGEEVIIKNVARSDIFEDVWELRIITNSGIPVTIYNWDSPSKQQEALAKLEAEGNVDKYWALEGKSFRLKHLYSCTVHKTQGSTYDEIYLDGADLLAALNAPRTKWSTPISKDLFMRLLYVAVSRMESKCHIYIGTVRNYNNLRK